MAYDRAQALIDQEIKHAGKHFAFLCEASSRYSDLAASPRADGTIIYVSWLAHEHTTNIEIVDGYVYAFLELGKDGTPLGRVYSGKVLETWEWLHSIQTACPDMLRLLVLSTRGAWKDVRDILDVKP